MHLSPRFENILPENSVSSFRSSDDNDGFNVENLKRSNESETESEPSVSSESRRVNIPQNLPGLFVNKLDPDKSFSSDVKKENLKNKNTKPDVMGVKLEDYVRTNSEYISKLKFGQEELVVNEYPLGKRNTQHVQLGEKRIYTNSNADQFIEPDDNNATKRKLWVKNSSRKMKIRIKRITSGAKVKRRKVKFDKKLKEKDIEYHSILFECVIMDQRYRLEELLFK